VEAATVGDEGMLGVEAFLTDDAVAPGETVVQVPDTDAVMMSAEDLRREVAEHGALNDLLGRYTQIVIASMMQTTACNALHQSTATLRTLAIDDARPDARGELQSESRVSGSVAV